LGGLDRTSRAFIHDVVSLAVVHLQMFAESYVCTAGAVARVEAIDVAGEVAEGEVAKLDAGVVWAFGAAGVSLVDVGLVKVSHCSRWTFRLTVTYLGDKDRECDVVDLDIGPRNIAHETLSTDPRLQTCSVQTAGDGDAVKVDVGDVGEFALALAERSNR